MTRRKALKKTGKKAAKTKALLSRRISRAILEYKLIEKDDRLLMAISGGKDSLTLAWFLSRMAPSFLLPFQIKAVHVRSSIQPVDISDSLKKLCLDWGLPLTILEDNVSQSLQPNQAPSCFLCARSRRKNLLHHAQQEGFNTLVLGHHMDDCLQTLFMNMLWHSETAALPPRLNHGPGLKIIRPLCLIQEHHIQDFADWKGWDIPPGDCPFQGDSRRRKAAEQLQFLTKGNDGAKYRLYKALSSIKPELLPPSKQHPATLSSLKKQEASELRVK